MSVDFIVLTYNVGNGRADPKKLVSMIRKSGADIVGLQELNDTQAESVDLYLAEEYPYRFLFPGGFAGKGILSRYPELNVTQVHLGPERPDLLVSLNILDFRLSVISAHPPPPRFRKSGFNFDSHTQNQINALALLAQENQPAILMGDFNFVSNSKEYDLIKEKGMIDAYSSAGKGAGFTLPRRLGPWRRLQWLNRLLSWIPLLPLARVDYIWYTQPLVCKASWVGNDAGSDHLPVLARMEIP